MLADPTAVADRGDDWADAFQASADLDTVREDALNWFVVAEDDQGVTLIRPLEKIVEYEENKEALLSNLYPGEDVWRMLDWYRYHLIFADDFEQLVLYKTGATRPEWWMEGAWTCRVTSGEPGIDTSARVPISLDPEQPPRSTDTELHLVLSEHNCDTPEDVRSRVRVRELDEGSTEIGVLIELKKRQHDWVAECAQVFPYSFMVPLEEPLGERAIYDLNRPNGYNDLRARLDTVLDGFDRLDQLVRENR